MSLVLLTATIADARKNNINMSLKAAFFSIPGQQVCLLTKKGTVPELKSLNKQRGRVSYDSIYLSSAEQATLTEDISSLDEQQREGSILLHVRLLSNT